MVNRKQTEKMKELSVTLIRQIDLVIDIFLDGCKRNPTIMPLHWKTAICSALTHIVAKTLIGLFDPEARDTALDRFIELCKGHPKWKEKVNGN